MTPCHEAAESPASSTSATASQDWFPRVMVLRPTKDSEERSDTVARTGARLPPEGPSLTAPQRTFSRCQVPSLGHHWGSQDLVEKGNKVGG